MRALVLAVALAACAHDAAAPRLPPIVGRVRALDGESLSFGALRGKPSLILVMTTWANPALIEVPHFAAIARRFGDRIQVLAVALDDRPEPVVLFARTFDVPFPVYVPDDAAEFVSARGPLGAVAIIPTSALVTAFGEVSARVEGVWPPGALEAAIEQLLADDRTNR